MTDRNGYQRRLSRRTVLIGGLASLAGVGVMGTAWWALKPHPSDPPLPQRPYTYKGHAGFVSAVAWSPDGTRIASAGVGQDRTAQVWDATSGTRLFLYTGHAGYVYTVVWSPDGTRIASGSEDTTVQVWNARNGATPFIYRGHSDMVHTVAWSPDGRSIASAGGDTTVQVWQPI
jgi:WD40 repeat protein